jgi:hypothetical protein
VAQEASFTSDAREERVDAAILTYLQAVDAGQPPDRQEFIARYPDLSAELQAFFDDHDRVGRLTQPRPDSADSARRLGETVDEANGAPVPIADGIPSTIAGYRPLRLLGAGGMGRVFEAEDSSGRRVALKLISPGFAASRVAVERFRQEGKLASRIAHPRCVFVLKADEEAGQPFIVMELMSGVTLKDVVDRQGPLEPTDAIVKILDVIEGLEEAHHAGVLHRDVKPANCYADAGGRVKVGDFGLSRSLAADMRLTRTGGFIGTPLFASPEQLRGEQLDERTDVYSVAATLYFLLTGQAPFQHADGASVIARVVTEPPPSPRLLRSDLSPALEQVVLRGLDRQRERRYQNLDELRQALLPLLPGKLTGAGLGLRLGAYFLDVVPFSVYGQLLYLLMQHGKDEVSWFFFVALLLPQFLYFWLTEGVWGCTLAKRLFRLRVTRAWNCEPPGLARSLWRTALLYLTSYSLVDCFLAANLHRMATADMAIMSIVGMFASLGIRASTMRASNGYRAFHEVLSGTRVVQLPTATAPAYLSGSAFHDKRPAAPQRSEQLPARLGPFAVLSLVHGDSSGKVLLAEDSSLERRVWIWLRPQGSMPLTRARRDLTRSTRPRWLASGSDQGAPWEAFVAPEGASLTELGMPLPWSGTRQIIVQLTEELQAAEAEGTLPAELSPAHVWLQPNGRVLLTDFAVCPLEAGSSLQGNVKPHTDGSDAQPFEFLAQVARTGLEGHTTADARAPIRAVLPIHARSMLDRLRGGASPYRRLAELRHDLEATARRATDMTLVGRALQLGVTICFVGFGLVSMLGWSRTGAMARIIGNDIQMLDAQAMLHVLDEPQLREEFLEGVPPDHALRQRTDDFPELLRRRLAGDAADTDIRINSLGFTRQWFIILPAVRARIHAAAEAEPLSFERVSGEPFAIRVTRPRYPLAPERVVSSAMLRTVAERASRPAGEVSSGESWPFLIHLACLLALFPAVWTASAFWFRGGISYRLAGVALVRYHGLNATRPQCALRSFIVWLPVTGLLIAVVWIDLEYRDALWLCSALQGLFILLLLAYAVIALRWPRRGPHDWLVGTHVVPQ